MANICNNYIEFFGEKHNIEEAKNLFLELMYEQADASCRLLDVFVSLWDDNSLIVEFSTKWSPEIDMMKDIAIKHKLSFILDYEELGNGLCGRAEYLMGTLVETILDEEDLNKFSYSSEDDSYIFEGTKYDNMYEILDILLSRKVLENKDK